MSRPYNLSDAGAEDRAAHLQSPESIAIRIATKQQVIWTAELIAAASILWRTGSTVREIALALGLKKNQISGMVHRNRASFPGRPSPIGKNAWSA